jgi:hypothetical protein
MSMMQVLVPGTKTRQGNAMPTLHKSKSVKNQETPQPFPSPNQKATNDRTPVYRSNPKTIPDKKVYEKRSRLEKKTKVHKNDRAFFFFFLIFQQQQPYLQAALLPPLTDLCALPAGRTELTRIGALTAGASLGAPSPAAMLLLAAMGAAEPPPLTTGAVRGLSTLRVPSSLSLRTILLAWLAEKMLWPPVLPLGGGEVAVGDRARCTADSRWRATWMCAPEPRPDKEELRRSFMAERILPVASLSAARERSRSEPEFAESSSLSLLVLLVVGVWRAAGEPFAGERGR